jgi:uncharacterized protein YjbI with pentapeptide repeats
LFKNCDLSKSNFFGANLEGVKFVNCKMTNSDLTEAIIVFEDEIKQRKKKRKDGSYETINIVIKKKTEFDKQSLKKIKLRKR